MYIWISILAFGICISLTDAFCQLKQPVAELDSKGNIIVPTACVDDDGTRHNFKTEWVKDCMDCSCDSAGTMQCCFNIPKPAEYDEEACTSTFDKKTCSYSVVKKNNPSETCEVRAYIG
ncbi:beta-microseminoprotein-like isoform X2 [Rhinatrema bivittatum]|uniref:beta-microseminoprotein-like isoform X2 n=1 Tax=Rhinatrema bivittatum TaxID=194408 RepID=UPI0011290A46|nr:beta-microseminoprotein-like isoform X2 [Rhinatrema bivittatum]